MNSWQTVRFEAVPMGLRPTHDNENPPSQRTTASRAATARSGNELANTKRFFNGAGHE
jgi:hypothetical protein